MKKIGKYFLILLSVLILLVVLLFAFLSPIAKYIIDKNVAKWTGRRITMGSLALSPFKGIVEIKDLKVYEASSDTVFFACRDIYIKANVKNILHKDYEIDSVVIDNPEVRVIQNGKKFNFDDLITHFSSPQPAPKSINEPETHYEVSNVIICNGGITYNNVPIHNIFRIHQLNVELPALSWNNPQAKVHIDFNYGTGGAFTIDLDANLKTFAYNLSLAIDKYDLSQYYAPLSAFLKLSEVKGMLTAKLRAHGKFDSPESFSMTGGISIRNIEMKDYDKRKFFALGEFATYIDTINIKDNMFVFRNILVDKPYVAYDDYVDGNNFSQMLKPHIETRAERRAEHAEKVKDSISKSKDSVDYSNIFALLQTSLKNSAIDFLGANYRADSIAIRNGEFVFNDHTPHHKFRYTVSKINIVTDEIGRKNKRVVFSATAALDDTGHFDMKANLGYDLRHKLFSYSISDMNIPDVSPIAKYLLEKNSVKWTGRVITTGNIKIKPLKGSIKIQNIKIYEPDSTNVFFACHDVYVRMNLKQMTDNVYEIDKIKIDNPEISIVQNGNNFNFDDLVKRFSSPPNQQQTNDSGLHYDVKNVIINKGNITYNNVPIHNIFRIHEFNFNMPELSWNNPNSKVHLDFNYGIGGAFDIDLVTNRKTLDYTMSLAVDSYDLSQYYAPLNSILKISSLKGTLSTGLMLHGKFNNPQNVSTTGYIHLNDLEIRDTAKQKFFSLGELAISIDTVDVKNGMYSLSDILLDKPFLRFDYLPNGNNISRMIRYTAPPTPVKDTTTGGFKPDYSNVFTLISSSIKLMAVDIVNTDYHTDSIDIRNGQLLYNDYTLNTPFHYNISDIDILTDEISASTKKLKFNISATLNDTGKLVMNASMGLDLKDMLLDYDVSNLRMSDLNPYTEYYVGTTFLDGYMKYHSTDSVINRNLKSANTIHLEGVETSEEQEGKPVYNLPVRMAISLLKDINGNIDIKLPANGNLDDPDYKIGPLVGRISKDLILKTAASPFKFLGKLINRNPEDMKRFNFEYIQDKLNDKQLDKLDDVYKVLKKKKELGVEITQVIDSVEEKAELALFLAKDRYYDYTVHPLEDSLLSKRQLKQQARDEDKMDIHDTLFGKYLNKELHLTGDELFSVEDKCIMLIGDSLLDKEVHDLMRKRNKAVTEFLVTKKSLNPKRVKVVMNTDSVKVTHTPEPEFDIKYNAGEGVKEETHH